MSRVYSGSVLTIDRFVSGFSNNAYLISSTDTGESMIIDTPANPDELLAAAAETDVKAILITHNHDDHLQGFDSVTAAHPAPVGIGAADAPAIDGRGGIERLDVSEGSLIRVGGISLRAIFTPGHTPGSTCYMLAGESPGATPHVFTGDTLFPGGPGKSRSAEALQQIVVSIERHLLTLPPDTAVMPGHGEFTTVAASSAEYEVYKSRPRDAGDFGDVTWSGS